MNDWKTLKEPLRPEIQKIHDFYDVKPGAAIYRKEFYFYILDKWISEGHLKPRDEVADYDAYLADIFQYDEPAVCKVEGLGWVVSEFMPKFETKILEDRGKYELVQDSAGRGVLYFKNKRKGFMPEYVTHPVKDWKTWEQDVKWRLDPNAAGREELTRDILKTAKEKQQSGTVVVQRAIGGYMYLRSLFGPEELLYMFYDDPDLIHDCMKTWFTLNDSIIAKHQQVVSFDELFLGEDICYNHGPLISPDMIREFLFPYYQQLYQNMKARNQEKQRTLHFQLDTDGLCPAVMDLYKSIGVDYFSPFEVASGCDIVKIGQEHPGIKLSGGIDKRAISAGGDVIKQHLEYIMPTMRKRGGYIPTCDHGVPEETSFENYMYYRKLMNEYCI